MSARLHELVALSRTLGEPSRDLAILAEGNTSCSDGPVFWVKGSGASLDGIEADGFARCRPEPLLQALGRGLSDQDVRELLLEARDGDGPKPSVEAFMHAWLLSLPGVEFVGHVHPTPVLALVCSPAAQQLARMRFFPDEVVCCGPASAWVAYVDPGLALASRIKETVSAYVDAHGEWPKTILLQNHGLIALGRTAQEVETAVLMSVKAARIVLLAGGLKAVETDRIVPLSPQAVERIRTRPDEHDRQALLWQARSRD